MKNKILTAEEFLLKDNSLGVDLRWDYVAEDALIRFAKLHVKAALEAAVKKAQLKNEWEGNTGSEYCNVVIDKKSILNAYPENLIK